VRQTHPHGCILPEPETRNGLSLARNDAFATITRSMLPACAFASTQKISCARSIPGSSTRFGFEAESGDFITPDPLHTPISSAPVILRHPLPFRSFPTFRIKAFDRSLHRKLASPDARLISPSPPLVLSIAPRIKGQDCVSPCLAIVP
jgi:hypothetical protein